MGQAGRYRARKNKSREFPSTYFFFDPKFICVTMLQSNISNSSLAGTPVNRYVKRGTLGADLAEVMKKLAKDKMLRALSNVDYAKGDYEKEMGQAALKKEALKVTYRYKQ